jgi:hypothetical protein
MARKQALSGPGSAAELLDEALPLAEPAAVEAHHHAAVLEVSDPAQLVELAADAALRPFLLCRLSPTVALVDPGQAQHLVELLRKRGHTPKFVQQGGGRE